MTDELVEITIAVSPSLAETLDAAAELMEMSREDMVMKILIRWEKEQRLPLHGKDMLCNIIPGP
jgi:hypothetical protein